MLKKLYSNSGLILIAVLAAGIWFSNITDYFSQKPAAISAAPSPSPTPSFEELLEQEWKKGQDAKEKERQELEKFLRENPPENATALCADGTYSYSASRRGTCSHHGGVARWISR